jgi:hypothetical protein
MIPPTLLRECRDKAEGAMNDPKPTSWVAALVIVVIWLLLGFLAVAWVGHSLQKLSCQSK